MSNHAKPRFTKPGRIVVEGEPRDLRPLYQALLDAGAERRMRLRAAVDAGKQAAQP